MEARCYSFYEATSQLLQLSLIHSLTGGRPGGKLL
jgi:hypothetical protein